MEVIVLWVDVEDGEFNIYSLICNCVYINVVFMLGEEDWYKLDFDLFIIVDFFMSSYFNYLFCVLYK